MFICISCDKIIMNTKLIIGVPSGNKVLCKRCDNTYHIMVK